jgi:hypothetical protein
MNSMQHQVAAILNKEWSYASSADLQLYNGGATPVILLKKNSSDGDNGVPQPPLLPSTEPEVCSSPSTAAIVRYPLQATPDLDKFPLSAIPLLAAASVSSGTEQDSVILESGSVDMDTDQAIAVPLPPLDGQQPRAALQPPLERLRQRILAEGYGKCHNDPEYIQLRALCCPAIAAYTRALEGAGERFRALVPWLRLASANVTVLPKLEHDTAWRCMFCATQHLANARLVVEVPARGRYEARMCESCAQMYHSLWIVECPEAALAKFCEEKVIAAIVAAAAAVAVKP